jgi:hypothetical protein
MLITAKTSNASFSSFHDKEMKNTLPPESQVLEPKIK